MNDGHLPMYLAGELVETEDPLDVRCPATGQSAGSAAWAASEHVTTALESAEAALPTWSTSPVAERVDWMRRLREEVVGAEQRLRELVRLETGKAWEETAEDHRALVDGLDYFSLKIRSIEPLVIGDRSGSHRHYLERQPVGVVGAFIAWNFPLLNLAFKLTPAMAAGCPIVIKPSPKTPLSAYAVGELCARIGLPAGVVNILCGPDDIVGDGISESPIPALLTVIGSTATGRHVIRRSSSSIKRFSMELGGNAPAIVFDDADVQLAAGVIGDLKFGNAGQICVAPNRVFAHVDIIEELTDRLIDRAASIRVGFGPPGSVDMGPMIDRAARDRVQAMIDEAVQQGACVVAGGGPPGDSPEGSAYLAPTVVRDVTPEMRLYREEIFGPVIGLTTFDDDDTAVANANDTEAGLASYVFTREADRAQHTVRRLRFGEVQVNGVKYGVDLPHCGIKQSGMGVDCSELALDDYLSPKRVSWAVQA